MASIKKLTNPTRYRARIKRNARVKSKTFTTHRAASTWAKRVENDSEMMDALGSAGAGITFQECAREYLGQWKGRDHTHPKQIQYWIDAIGETRLSDLSVDIVRSQIKKYAAGKAQCWNGPNVTGYKLKELNKPRQAGTVNRMKAAGSAVMKYAVAQGYLNDNPFRKVPGLAENAGRQRYLSDDERTRLFEAVDNSTWPKMKLLVLMALTTGCRQAELLGLRWSDIDFKQRTAYLATTKNGDPRVVPIPNVTINELLKFREVGKGLVFPSVIKPNRPFEFRKHWAKALAEAGIEGFRWHDLRHSAASMLVNNGVDLFTVGQVLGHRDPKTTARYAHLSIETKQAAVDSVMDGIL